MARALGTLVLLVSTGLAFQFFILLRTDLYAVLTIGLGCLNLTRVNQLLIERTIRALTANETKELEEAHRQRPPHRHLLPLAVSHRRGIRQLVFLRILPRLDPHHHRLDRQRPYPRHTDPARFWDAHPRQTRHNAIPAPRLLMFARERHRQLRSNVPAGPSDDPAMLSEPTAEPWPKPSNNAG
jgi:hypothetical protein